MIRETCPDKPGADLNDVFLKVMGSGLKTWRF
jgi:hypothetical protein